MGSHTSEKISYDVSLEQLFLRCCGQDEVGLNPLRSNSDQRQISLYNINDFSVREVMRINDIITQHEFP